MTEASKVVGTTDGSEPQFYRTFDIWMDDMEQLQLAMATPEITQMREDLKNFATGGVSILISRTEPETSQPLTSRVPAVAVGPSKVLGSTEG